MSSLSTQDIQNCIQYLRQLIQINTVNPPGNEIAAVRYIKSLLDQKNIPCTILEAAPTRANIITRLKGDGSKKPLLLTTHLDVVPVESAEWEVDPFEAQIRDGFIWGRGAVDMKNMAAMELAVFLKLAENPANLKRDVIFAGVADEEAGCHHGSQWLVKNHPDLIRAEYGLNEVGGFSLWVDDQVFYPIGVAEKGVCWFEVTAKGEPGHGSMPHANQAVAKLAHATSKLAENNLPFHAAVPVCDFLDHLAIHQPYPKKIVLKLLKNKYLSNFIIHHLLPKNKQAQGFWNLFRNTTSPTILRAGAKVNVIPSQAHMQVDGRILPGSCVQEFIAEVKQAIGQNFDFKILEAQEPCVFPYPNDFYQLLQKSLKKHDPAAHPLPFMIPGFTDSNHYSKLGIILYGFAPAKLPRDLDFTALFHGHNERIPISAVEFGVKVLWDVVREWCH